MAVAWRSAMISLAFCGMIVLLAACAEGRAVRYKCQYLKSHNRTGLVCTPVFEGAAEKPRGPKPSTFTSPEAFNGNAIRHRESACSNLLQLAEKMKGFEDGAWKYCDPSKCLRESPHCARNEITDKCRRCFGRCWLMYGFPDAPGEGSQKAQSKSYPCDPNACGIHVFCGGYKFIDDDGPEPPRLAI